jgi:hypothetical protein
MTSHLTVCVVREWADVDSVREQEKLEARKKLENAARCPYGQQSHTSGAPWNDGGRSFSTKERLASY